MSIGKKSIHYLLFWSSFVIKEGFLILLLYILFNEYIFVSGEKINKYIKLNSKNTLEPLFILKIASY